MKQLMISLLLLFSCFSVLAQEKTANREVKKSRSFMPCMVELTTLLLVCH